MDETSSWRTEARGNVTAWPNRFPNLTRKGVEALLVAASCRHPPVLTGSAERIIDLVPADGLVLDVGGWNQPFARADWIIDLMPYETRGRLQGGEERFDRSRWVERDICERSPWPFEDGQFEFAVCSHTLEDVRDPVWVCSELDRVARAGYIEVPSRLEEQTWGVNGEWAGWSHHHWLVDLGDGDATFTLKPHFLHARPDLQISVDVLEGLGESGRVSSMFWRGELAARESIHYEAAQLEEYLRAPIDSAGLTPRSRQGRTLRARARSAKRAFG
jgi:hypothetical protein